MNESGPKWEPLTDISQAPSWFSNETVKSCFLTQIYSCCALRMAWGWDASSLGSSIADSPDIAKVMYSAERKRERGLGFAIRGCPAIALVGDAFEVVLQQQMYLDRCREIDIAPGMISGGTLMEVTKSILAGAAYLRKEVVYIGENGFAKPAILPFMAFHSVPRGIDYPLSWEVLTSDNPLQGFLRISPRRVLRLVESVAMHINAQGLFTRSMSECPKCHGNRIVAIISEGGADDMNRFYSEIGKLIIRETLYSRDGDFHDRSCQDCHYEWSA